MNIRVFVSLLLGIWSLSPAAVSAQQAIWGGARAGMTPDEVLASVPNATEIARNDRGERQVELVGLTINRSAWRARFQFEGGRHFLTSLSPVPETSGPTVTRLFAEVRRDLSVKYGPPADCGGRTIGGLVRVDECSWSADGVAIKLSLMLSDPDRPLLTVVYQAEDATESAL